MQSIYTGQFASIGKTILSGFLMLFLVVVNGNWISESS